MKYSEGKSSFDRSSNVLLSGNSRGGGTGGAGGAIAPPTFGSSIIIHSYGKPNIFGWLNICQHHQFFLPSTATGLFDILKFEISSK